MKQTALKKMRGSQASQPTSRSSRTSSAIFSRYVITHHSDEEKEHTSVLQGISVPRSSPRCCKCGVHRLSVKICAFKSTFAFYTPALAVGCIDWQHVITASSFLLSPLSLNSCVAEVLQLYRLLLKKVKRLRLMILEEVCCGSGRGLLDMSSNLMETLQICSRSPVSCCHKMFRKPKHVPCRAMPCHAMSCTYCAQQCIQAFCLQVSLQHVRGPCPHCRQVTGCNLMSGWQTSQPVGCTMQSCLDQAVHGCCRT